MPDVTVFSDPLFLQHETGRHPENAGRLRAVHQRLESLRGELSFREGSPKAATDDQLQAVHSPEYLDQLQTLHRRGGGQLDPDTLMSENSLKVARHAAGTACEAVRAVVAGETRRALCLVRPPGHHALATRAMGFCLMNNVAVAAQSARQEHGLDRVLIVDWDVHHGNGTQDLFYDVGQVVFFSIHRYPFYPGTGAREETGTGAGLGATFNIPVEFGTSRDDFFALFEEGLTASVKVARPELILISAGFDAHRLDPIGSLGLETEDFGRLTRLVCEAAEAECQGRIVSLLEGGYHPQALADSVAQHLQLLCDD